VGIFVGPELAQTPLAAGSAIAGVIFAMLGRLARKTRPNLTRPVVVELVLLAEATFAYLPASVHRHASQLAYAGFLVVLVHPLMFWLMQIFTPWAANWLIFAVTISASWCIGIVALQTPMSRWLTGVERGTVHRAVDG
jgi:hypothetical protein